MNIALLDLDSVMNIIWRAGGYHRQDVVDYPSYFKSVRQAVNKHVGRLSPTHQAVLLADPSENQKRSIDQDYRSTRFMLPMAGILKMRSLLRDIESDGFKVIVCPRSEPYDVMSYLAEKLGSAEMTFVSSDKRVWSLVSENRSVYWPYAKNPALNHITPSILAETHNGLTPTQFREMMVLAELPGLGNKKASKIIKDYESLQSMSEQLADIDGAVGKIIRENLKTEGRRAYRAIFPSKITSIGIGLSELKLRPSIL